MMVTIQRYDWRFSGTSSPMKATLETGMGSTRDILSLARVNLSACVTPIYTSDFSD
jgi:hypothetical protein